jgi:hypothetical protein
MTNDDENELDIFQPLTQESANVHPEENDYSTY